MKTILEKLFRKYFAKLPLDEYQLKLVLKAAKEFAQKKCTEQRILCAKAYEESDCLEFLEVKASILNAKEPTYDV